MFTNSMSVVILAAGKGTRLYSNLPKVLYMIAGKPIVQHVIDTATCLGAQQIHLIYGYGGDLLKSILTAKNINWVLQKEQLGTGHAVQQVIPFFSDNEDIMILYGDIPFISQNTLQQLRKSKPKDGIILLTVILDNPSGYGRIIRKNGVVTGIIEHKDASNEQMNIKEVNTGIMIVHSSDLKRWLVKLDNNNAQREFYITDIINMAFKEGVSIQTLHPICINETAGVNDLFQLVTLERNYQQEQAKKLLLAGVMIRDPSRFDLRGTLDYGYNVEIDTNVILEGKVTLGNRVKIGTGCTIKNSIIADDCEIKPYTLIEDANIAESCTIGPFARIRLGCILSKQAHIGNFVEMKKSILGAGSKAGHLSYLGDTEIGAKVNIGAGTITCNYDGVNKYQTIIGDNVFIGSDSQLVAPLMIANGATIAAGTTVMKDVINDNLVYNPKTQNQKSGWQRPVRKK